MPINADDMAKEVRRMHRLLLTLKARPDSSSKKAHIERIENLFLDYDEAVDSNSDLADIYRRMAQVKL
jgi:hypothetical protein